jgi:hypothetical protein
MNNTPNKQAELEKRFNEFIETGALDKNEFQEYEISIQEFDNEQ